MNDNSQILKKFSPRQRIMAAALKLFVEQGYFNTNIPDLGRESKCSVGSIYHSFKNKEEIARTLYEECIIAFRQALAEAVLEKDDIEDVVKTLVKSLMEFAEVNVQLSKYIWLCRHNEFLSGMINPPTRVGYDQLGRHLSKVFKKAIREDKITTVNANILWTLIFGSPVSYIRDWLDGYNSRPPGQVADRVADLCWLAIAKHDTK